MQLWKDYFFSREVGGRHWVSIYFHCMDCEEGWEEEFQIEVTITVTVVAGTEAKHEN